MMERLTFKVTDIRTQMRISDYLKNKLGFSSALITKVKFGGVFVNGETVTMRKNIKDEDIITVILPDEESEGIPAIDIPINILYEDEHILAVNKPKDMPTHPSKGNSLPTLANAVMAYYNSNFTFRALNRLDRGTSGIVIIAKNAFSAAKLGRAMKSGCFSKKYTALIKGLPENKNGIIDAPIERECEGSIKRIVTPSGKRALTEYSVLKNTVDGNSICEIKLHTGRTHQIRVHMAYIGHPLVGDFLYGERNDVGYILHCSEISFPHPTKNDILTIKSPAENIFERK